MREVRQILRLSVQDVDRSTNWTDSLRTPETRDVLRAYARIAENRTVFQGYTRVIKDAPLLRDLVKDVTIALGCDNELPTNSFKVRGAVDALQAGREVITASSGNHGMGIAYAASEHVGRSL